MDRLIPKQYKEIYRKAMGGRSRKMAIKAFCLECVGWDRGEITICTDSGCPLYPYRPYKQTVKVPISDGVFEL